MNSVDFLEQALTLARSVPSTLPNPPVGAVLVKDGRVLATGVHLGPGHPHAEIVALDRAVEQGIDVRGSTLYSTLEPCCHNGLSKRTPPCVPRLIQMGVAEVWIGCADPNPEVAGRGAKQLIEAGVSVHWAPDPAPSQDLIREFRVGITEHRAWIHLKWAQTLDGRVAAPDGSSRWITGKEARTEAHRLRARHQAVLVGASTLRQDDPSLTVRHLVGPQPERLILAGENPVNANARIFHDEFKEKNWIITRKGSSAWEQAPSLGSRRLEGSFEDLPALAREFYKAGIYSVLVEGGPTVLGAFFFADVWDAASVFQAQKILGSGAGISGRKTVASISEARNLSLKDLRRLGEDVLMEFEPEREIGLREGVCSPV